MNQPTDLPPWADLQVSLQLPDLCAQGEGQTLEFKERLPAQPHDIGKSIAAFASSNAGLLIYGIANDGSVVGLPEAGDAEGRDRIAQRVMSAARDVRPPVHPVVAWAIHDGKTVCVVKIDRGFEALYYSNHRAMIRRGGASRPAEASEIEQVFRVRYASGPKTPPLPLTRQIAKRMGDVLNRMNAGRHEALTVADLARAMDLSSPADLDAVLSGHLAATFAMLDQFCSRFAIDKDWLTTGRAEPFTSPIEHMVLPEHYLRSIEDDQPATVYAVRSKSRVGESFLVVESDPMKFWRLPDVWHVSDHVGGGGSRDLLSLYTLFKQWSKAAKPYMVLGRYVEPEVAEDVFNGKAWPGIVANLPMSHWWDDLTDIEHKWTTQTRSSKAYGKEFVAAQDIVREMLARAEL